MSDPSNSDPQAELPTPDWEVTDLEAAYLRALEAVESVEQAVGEELGQDLSEPDSETVPVVVAPAAVPLPVDVAPASSVAPPITAPPVVAPPAVAQATPQPIAVAAEQPQPVAKPTAYAPTAPRILEACLFVGGQPLSAKRLANILEGNSDSSAIDRIIDEMNQEYAQQQRPYEIRLVDGGYRMALRQEFEATRNRVHGVGPKEVKLGQDALEILALVAYKQPILHADVEQTGKSGAGNLLRQLLRRELISLTRVDASRNGVQYQTTARFLQLFGLGTLSELPQIDELSLR